LRVLGSKTGVSKHCEFTEILEIVLFWTFWKLQKNDVKIEFWKFRKTRSDSKTDTNVCFKVQNAGPTFYQPFCKQIVGFIFEKQNSRLRKLLYAPFLTFSDVFLDVIRKWFRHFSSFLYLSNECVSNWHCQLDYNSNYWSFCTSF